MCYKKQDITLEQHEKDDLLDCDSDYWLGSFPGHPINYSSIFLALITVEINFMTTLMLLIVRIQNF